MKFKDLLLLCVGLGIGYFLASDEKDEIIGGIKEGFSKGKDLVNDNIKKAKNSLSESMNQ
jgi:hypothetical protein